MRSVVRIGKTTVKVDTRKWDKIQKQLSLLKNSYALVGLHEGSRRPDGTLVAEVGFWNEFGAPGANIPERSWMREWFDSNKNLILKKQQELIGKVIDLKIDAKTAVKRLGAFVEAAYKKSITDLRTPPNEPATIERKGSSNPLIDEGIMRAEVKSKEFFNQAVMPK